MADERSQRIAGFVRQKLSKASPVSLQDNEIFYTANLVLPDLMMKTRCLEREVIVDLAQGQSEYDIIDEHLYKIRTVIASWDRKFFLVPPKDWDYYTGLTEGDYPQYGTIFGGTIYIAPPPTVSGLSLKLWGVQCGVVTPMNSVIAPETPEMADLALCYAILKEYDLSFLPEYERQCQTVLHHRNKLNEGFKEQALIKTTVGGGF